MRTQQGTTSANPKYWLKTISKQTKDCPNVDTDAHLSEIDPHP